MLLSVSGEYSCFALIKIGKAQQMVRAKGVYMTITASDIHKKSAEITAEGAFFELETINLGGADCLAYKHANKNLVEVLQSGRNHGAVDFIVYENERYTFDSFFHQ